MHRTNIYLDEDQRAAIRRLSAASGTTMSDVVRRAVAMQVFSAGLKKLASVKIG